MMLTSFLVSNLLSPASAKLASNGPELGGGFRLSIDQNHHNGL
jgi:hypothetical protein